MPQANLFGDALELATPAAALVPDSTPPAALSTRPEKPKGEIARAIPPGYFRIKDGPLRDDDLVWSYSRKEFLRNDSELWTDAKPTDADGLIYVLRSIEAIKPEGTKTYTFRR